MTRDGRHTLHIGWCPLLATGPGPGVGVIPIIITFSQFPHSLACNCPDVSSPGFASSQATYANQTRAQMSRLGMRGESWEMFQTHGCDVWWGTTRLPSPSALAVKCAPIQILTPRAAPSCLLKHSYNWSSQLSWFLFTESWGLMSVRFDPDLSIFPPDNHPSPLLLYCYRVSSSWQKTVSGRSKCFRKTNEANVNFLPVEFRSNNVFRFTRRKKETVKTVIIPKIWEGAQVFMNEVAFWIISLIFSDCQHFHFSCVKLWISNPRQHWSSDWPGSLSRSILMCLLITALTRSINEWKMTGKILTLFTREFRSSQAFKREIRLHLLTLEIS